MSMVTKATVPLMSTKWLTIIVSFGFVQAAFCEPLFTQHGTDPSFHDVLKSGKLAKGHSSKTGVTGSKIDVKNQLVELKPEARRTIAQDIKLHTLGNSAIHRADFGKWSRWYQEDGKTQVFRLFQGEENTHNSRGLAARVETFSNTGWKHGAWHEWSGTYTIIKPHGAAIFQAKNDVNDWSFQLDMSENGDVRLNHRRGEDAVIVRNMVGKPFHIRVRDNGLDYEVFLDGKEVGKGSYPRPEGKTNFRWGMYLGSHSVNHDAMIFVSGATVDGKNGN